MSQNGLLPIQHNVMDRLNFRMAQGVEPARIQYRARTSATTPVILYIERRTGFEFKPPKRALVYVETVQMGYNATTDAAAGATPLFIAYTFTTGADGEMGTITKTGTEGVIVASEANDASTQNEDVLRLTLTPPNNNDTIWVVNATINVVSVPMFETVTPPTAPTRVLG